MTENTNTTPTVIVSFDNSAGTITVNAVKGVVMPEDFMAAAASANCARYFEVMDNDTITCTEEVKNCVFESGDDPSNDYVSFDFFYADGTQVPEATDDVADPVEEANVSMVTESHEAEPEPEQYRAGGLVGRLDVAGVDYTLVNGSIYDPATKAPFYVYIDPKGRPTIANQVTCQKKAEGDGGLGQVLRFESPLAYALHCGAQHKLADRLTCSGMAAVREYRSLIAKQELTVDPTNLHIRLAEAMMWKFLGFKKNAEALVSTKGYFHTKRVEQLGNYHLPYADFIGPVLEEIRSVAAHNLNVLASGGSDFLQFPEFRWLHISPDTPRRMINAEIVKRVKSHERRMKNKR